MSSQMVVSADVQGVQRFGEKKEAEVTSKTGAVAMPKEAAAANAPDEFEVRRRLFFAGTKNAS